MTNFKHSMAFLASGFVPEGIIAQLSSPSL
jgi:hypothetical protein